MTQKGRLVGIACIAIVFASAGFFFGRRRSHLSLTVPDSALQLGKVWAESEVEVSLPITNESQVPIRIHEFVVSCRCTSLTPSSLTVPSQSTRTIAVQLDLAKLSTSHVANGNGVLASIRPVADRELPISWEFTASIVRPIVGLPRVVSLGDLKRDSLKGKSLKYSVHVASEVANVHVPTSSEYFELVFERTNEESQLSVVPRSSAPCGEFNEKVGLSVTTHDGYHIPCGTIFVCGHYIRDVRPSSTAIGYGALRLGERGAATLSLESRSGQDFVVKRIVADGHQVVADGTTFNIGITATEIGQRNGVVLFDIAQAGMDEYQVTVNTNYYGLSERRSTQPAVATYIRVPDEDVKP